MLYSCDGKAEISTAFTYYITNNYNKSDLLLQKHDFL